MLTDNKAIHKNLPDKTKLKEQHKNMNIKQNKTLILTQKTNLYKVIIENVANDSDSSNKDYNYVITLSSPGSQ
jgi:uncharacterized protein YllA (UPF0747 family)